MKTPDVVCRLQLCKQDVWDAVMVQFGRLDGAPETGDLPEEALAQIYQVPSQNTSLVPLSVCIDTLGNFMQYTLSASCRQHSSLAMLSSSPQCKRTTGFWDMPQLLC